MFKKIHSVLTVILSVLLLLHLLITGLVMTKIVTMQRGFAIVGFALLFIMVVHALISLGSILLNRGGSCVKSYTSLNLRCYIQRISGIAILPLMYPHVNAFIKPGASAAAGASAISMVNLICLIAMTVVCCVHIGISIPNALVGLGVIVDEKPMSVAERICYVIVAVVGIFSIFAALSMAGVFGGGV